MFNFLKICGYGLLAIILSPFWVALLALMAVYGIIAFLVMTIRIIIIDIRNLFAKNKDNVQDPLGLLPEDYEVIRIKAAQDAILVETIQHNPFASTAPHQPENISEIDNYDYIDHSALSNNDDTESVSPLTDDGDGDPDD